MLKADSYHQDCAFEFWINVYNIIAKYEEIVCFIFLPLSPYGVASMKEQTYHL